MCETGSEWEKSPRRKIIQIFFLLFQISFLLGRKTSQKKSLFYWYQKVFDLQCVETLPLRFEVVWLIRESLWETELVRQLRLIDDCISFCRRPPGSHETQGILKSNTQSESEKLPEKNFQPEEVWWCGGFGLRDQFPEPEVQDQTHILKSWRLCLYTLSYSVTDIRRLFLGGFDSDFFFLWDQKRSKKTF